MAVAIGRDARPKREARFATPTSRALLLLPGLECVADKVAPAGFGQFPDMERAVRRACDVKRMAAAVSCLLPREDKAIRDARAQSVGEPLVVAVGAGRFNDDPQGFRLASLPSADGGGDDEHGALGRDAGVACRACVRSHRRALAGCFPCCGP